MSTRSARQDSVASALRPVSARSTVHRHRGAASGGCDTPETIPLKGVVRLKLIQCRPMLAGNQPAQT